MRARAETLPRWVRRALLCYMLVLLAIMALPITIIVGAIKGAYNEVRGDMELFRHEWQD